MFFFLTVAGSIVIFYPVLVLLPVYARILILILESRACNLSYCQSLGKISKCLLLTRVGAITAEQRDKRNFSMAGTYSSSYKYC